MFTYHGKMGPSFLKQIETVIQRSCRQHQCRCRYFLKIHSQIFFHGKIRIRITNNQCFHQQNADNIIFVMLIDWNARESSFIDLSQAMRVQFGVGIQHQHILPRYHRLHHRIVGNLQSAFDYGLLIRMSRNLSHNHIDFFVREHNTFLLRFASKKTVQQPRQWFTQREQQPFEGKHNRIQFIAGFQWIRGKHRLRENLTKDQHKSDRDYHRQPRCNQLVQKYRQCLHT
mmetsp:Transcript_37256/g.61273  ORF Transcript_37256/g.61273 Transcript_37256/m.61273 type:complete len:228 (+) Transcript_37256:658-1341(+)